MEVEVNHQLGLGTHPSSLSTPASCGQESKRRFEVDVECSTPRPRTRDTLGLDRVRARSNRGEERDSWLLLPGAGRALEHSAQTDHDHQTPTQQPTVARIDDNSMRVIGQTDGDRVE